MVSNIFSGAVAIVMIAWTIWIVYGVISVFFKMARRKTAASHQSGPIERAGIPVKPPTEVAPRPSSSIPSAKAGSAPVNAPPAAGLGSQARLHPGKFHVNYWLGPDGQPASSEHETAWLEARRTGLTATDAHQLVKLNGQFSAQRVGLMEAKLGNEGGQFAITEAMQYGIDREAAIAKLVHQEFGIEHNTYLCRGVNSRHLATPDGIGDGVICEIKTSNRPLSSLVGHYRDQLQWQLHVTASPAVLFAVENRESREIEWEWVPRDEARVAMLVLHADLFLEELDRNLAQNFRIMSDAEIEQAVTPVVANAVRFIDPAQAAVSESKGSHQTTQFPSRGPRENSQMLPEQKAWSRQESHLLLEAYSSGRSIERLARLCDAEARAVVTELARWLLVTTGELVDSSAPRFMDVWSSHDFETLRSDYRDGRPLAPLAKRLGRDQLGVAFKLFEDHRPVVSAKLMSSFTIKETKKL